jgi:hypothetical protein
MKLFIVHAGYYDSEIGIYELHTNFLLAAANVVEVKKLVKEKDIFRKKHMHIDAVQEIEVVDGFRVNLVPDQENSTKLTSYDYTQMKQLKDVCHE